MKDNEIRYNFSKFDRALKTVKAEVPPKSPP
jgi:hypothetical protein